MTEINSVKDISVSSFKTSCCFTGALLDDSLEQKLTPIKKRLVKRALRQYKTISACTPICFQVYEQKLLFWFNSNETTKTLSQSINEPIAIPTY